MQRLTILSAFSGGPKATAAFTSSMKAVDEHLRRSGGFFGLPFHLEVWDDHDWEARGLPTKAGWRSQEASRLLAERVRARPDIAAVSMWGGNWIGAKGSEQIRAFLDETRDLPIVVLSGTSDPEHVLHPGSFSLLPGQIDRVPLLERFVAMLPDDASIAWVAKSDYAIEQRQAVREACRSRGLEYWEHLVASEHPTGTNAAPEDLRSVVREIETRPPATHFMIGLFSLNLALGNWCRDREGCREVLELNTGRRPDWMPPGRTRESLVFATDRASTTAGATLSRILSLGEDYPKQSLDRLLLLQHASQLVDAPAADAGREEVFQAWCRGLRLVDASTSVFVGTSTTIWFDPESRRRTSGEIRLSRKLSDSDSLQLHPLQLSKQPDGGFQQIPVAYVYVDLKQVNQVRIEDESADLDFFLDIRSLEEIGIEDLRISNAEIESLQVQTLIEKSEPEPSGTVHVKRYRVQGSFSFQAHLACFPMDCQVIGIDLVPKNPESRPFHIQGPPLALLDREFDLVGWSPIDAEMSKQIRFWHSPRTIEFRMTYRAFEGLEFRWLLKRRSKDTVLFVAVPLIVLLGVSYFASFSTLENAESKVAELAATMLATIALYFATSKPRSDELTILDRAFRVAYVSIGGLLGTVLVFEHFMPSLYEWAVRVWLFLMPALIVFELFRMRRLLRIQADAFRTEQGEG